MARSELLKVEDEKTPVSFREIVVQESRSLSDLVARETGIRHESPQVILFRNGEPVWNTSHHGITAESLREALESH
jgi:bacillithiol system protein YtxJ